MQDKSPAGKSLRTRMIGSATLVAVAMVAVLIVILDRTQYDLTREKHEERIALTELLAKRLDHRITMKVEALKRIAVQRQTQLQTSIPLVEEKIKFTHLALEAEHFNQGIFLLDASGNIILIHHAVDHPLETEIKKFLKREGALKSAKGKVQTVNLSGNNVPVLIFLQPLSLPELNVKEFVLGATDITDKAILNEINSFRLGDTGYINVTDKKNNVIFSSKPQKLHKTIPHHDLILQARVLGGVIIREEKDEGTIAAATLLPETGWSLVVEQAAEEFYGNISALRKSLISLVIILSAAFISFNLIVSKTLVRPILSLSKRALGMAGGELESPIVDRGPGEIGILSESMEEMRKNLQTLLTREREYKTELESEVSSKTERLQLLNEISLSLSQTLEVDELIRRTVDRTIELLGAYSSGMFLMEEDGKTLKMMYTPRSIVPASDLTLLINEGVAGLAVAEGKAIAIDISQYPSNRFKNYFLNENVKRFASVPLYGKEKLLGAMAFTSLSKDAFSGEELDFLDSIANVVSSSMENALLFRQLGSAKNEWETTFDSIADLITIHDKDYNIVRANEAVFEFMGLSPNEVIGRKCYDLFHNGATLPFHGCPVEKLTEIKKDGPLPSAEQVIKDQHFKVTVFPVKNDKGELWGLVHVARNINEEKRLMEALEFRARSATVLNELTKAVNSSLEIDTMTTTLTSELRKIFDVDRISMGRLLTEEDKIGFKIYQDLTGELEIGKEYVFKASVSPSTKRVWDDQVVHYCENLHNSTEPLDRLLNKEGLNSYLTVPVIADGETMATLALVDREERRFSKQEIEFLEEVADLLSVAMKNARLYETLERTLDELKSMHLQVLQAEKLSSMGKLSAGTAHEILNPLNIISMQAQIMEMDWNLGPDQEKAITNILTQVERIKKIADGLRTFSREYKLKGEAIVNLNDVIEESLNLIEHDLKLNNIEIVKNLIPGLPTIMADKGQLIQVILNIMMNAQDAMPEGGTLTIKSRLSKKGERDTIELEFSDTGTGIPSDVLPNIFDPFFTTKPEDKGTGLGLSICYGIVERMGGKIYAESANGEGSTFTLELPAL